MWDASKNAHRMLGGCKEICALCMEIIMLLVCKRKFEELNDQHGQLKSNLAESVTRVICNILYDFRFICNVKMAARPIMLSDWMEFQKFSQKPCVYDEIVKW